MPALLAGRQNGPAPAPAETIIPATYGALRDSPPPGTVVAAVLGSVAGFLVVVLLVYAALGFAPRPSLGAPGPGPERSVFSLRSRSRSRSRRRRRRRGSRSRRPRRAPETVEVRTRERYVVDDPAASRPPPVRVVAVAPSDSAPPPRAAAAPAADDDDVDEVVVIEEHSPPPPRRKSRRHSARPRSAARAAPLPHVRREETRRHSPGPDRRP